MDVVRHSATAQRRRAAWWRRRWVRRAAIFASGLGLGALCQFGPPWAHAICQATSLVLMREAHRG